LTLKLANFAKEKNVRKVFGYFMTLEKDRKETNISRISKIYEFYFQVAFLSTFDAIVRAKQQFMAFDNFFRDYR